MSKTYNSIFHGNVKQHNRRAMLLGRTGERLTTRKAATLLRSQEPHIIKGSICTDIHLPHLPFSRTASLFSIFIFFFSFFFFSFRFMYKREPATPSKHFCKVMIFNLPHPQIEMHYPSCPQPSAPPAAPVELDALVHYLQ